MEELKDNLLVILDRKLSEENQMVQNGLEGEIQHSILQEEIKDASFCIKAIEDEDEHKLRSVHGGTTSNSIYDALLEYFQQ